MVEMGDMGYALRPKFRRTPIDSGLSWEENGNHERAKRVAAGYATNPRSHTSWFNDLRCQGPRYEVSADRATAASNRRAQCIGRFDRRCWVCRIERVWRPGPYAER